MTDDRFRWGRTDIDLIEKGQKLTLCTPSVHPPIVSSSNSLLLNPEKVAADNSFTFSVRRGSGKTDNRVYVTPSYAVECPYSNCEDLIRR